MHMHWTGRLCVRFDRSLPLMEQHNFHPHCHCQEADSYCFSFVFPVLVFLECENFSLQQLFVATVTKIHILQFLNNCSSQDHFNFPSFHYLYIRITLKLILSES